VYKTEDFRAPRANIEQGGGKFKFWCQDDEGNLYLFKQGRPGTGENWAEVVACKLANLIGLPSAQYKFAKWHDEDTGNAREGVLTKKVLDDAHHLVLGNELLSIIDRDYPTNDTRKVKKHTVVAALAIIGAGTIQKPIIDTGHPLTKATDVLAGYFIFDALISNTDRHHENWGVVVVEKNKYFLCPTFDHASSLGRNEPQEKKSMRLSTKDRQQTVDSYTERAKSVFCESPTKFKLMTCRQAARKSLLKAPESKYWIEKIAEITEHQIKNILDQVSKEYMTDIDKQFCLAMLLSNKFFLEKLL
jgi:hypothetical protein